MSHNAEIELAEILGDEGGRLLRYTLERYEHNAAAGVFVESHGPDGSRPCGILSVNAASFGHESLPWHVVVKTWAENERIAALAAKDAVFQNTGRTVPLGDFEAEVWRLRAELLPVSAVRDAARLMDWPVSPHLLVELTARHMIAIGESPSVVDLPDFRAVAWLDPEVGALNPLGALKPLRLESTGVSAHPLSDFDLLEWYRHLAKGCFTLTIPVVGEIYSGIPAPDSMAKVYAMTARALDLLPDKGGFGERPREYQRN